MARLLNDRQEAFAKLLAASVPAIVAYREAGFGGGKYDTKNASKLKNRPKVRARVYELEQSTDDLMELRRRLLDRFLVASIMIDRLAMFEAGDLRGDLSDDERALIEGREQTLHGTKYLMPRKLDAAAQLAKLHGLDKADKLAISSGDGAPLLHRFELVYPSP
jgi:hypothetical protein